MSRSPGAGGHAVVVGGGMTGLLAVRVLSGAMPTACCP